jgi:disulfide bond formation protein DsbB
MSLPPDWPRHAPLLVLAGSVGALGFALVSQFFFGLEPCVLCIYQRWPYVATIALAVLALSLGRDSLWRPWLLAAAALAFLIGGGIGVFHVGVERHWWEGTAECTGGPAALTVEALRAQIVGRPPARCDEIAFSFLGLSMAGWNVVVSLALAGFSLAAARHLNRRGRP